MWAWLPATVSLGHHYVLSKNSEKCCQHPKRPRPGSMRALDEAAGCSHWPYPNLPLPGLWGTTLLRAYGRGPLRGSGGLRGSVVQLWVSHLIPGNLKGPESLGQVWGPGLGVSPANMKPCENQGVGRMPCHSAVPTHRPHAAPTDVHRGGHEVRDTDDCPPPLRAESATT